MLRLRLGNCVSKKNIGLITQFCILFILVIGLINKSQSLINVCSLLSIAYFFVFSVENCTYFLFSITIFENAFTLFNIRSILFLALIYSARIIKRKSLKMPSGLVGTLFLLCSIEFLRNIVNVSLGMVLNNLSLILLFVVLSAYGNKLKLDISKIILSFGFSVVLSMYFVIDYYGGLGVYLNSFMSAGYAMRFGGEVGEQIGGAMAIPIYALLQISMTICYLIEKKDIPIVEKIVECVLMAICMVYGALTISRSFYMGLVIIAFLVAIFQRKNTLGKTLFVLLAITVAISLVYRIKPDILNSMFERLFDRISNDSTGTGSRTLIWASAFECLSRSWLGILFGYGGHYTSADFLTHDYTWLQAGLHNFYLDVLMSWGVVGIFAVIYIGVKMWKKLKSYKNSELFMYIPTLVLFYFAMTALRTTSLKPYIYLYIVLYFATNLTDERNTV